MLPPTGIEPRPLVTSDSKSNTLLFGFLFSRSKASDANIDIIANFV